NHHIQPVPKTSIDEKALLETLHGQENDKAVVGFKLETTREVCHELLHPGAAGLDRLVASRTARGKHPGGNFVVGVMDRWDVRAYRADRIDLLYRHDPGRAGRQFTVRDDQVKRKSLGGSDETAGYDGVRQGYSDG